MIQIALNFIFLSESCQPKQLFATYAAASGAVIDEVIPDAKRPIPKKYIAEFPYKGSKPLARSITPFTSLLFTEAAVIIIERDTMPPIRIEKKLSNLATFNLFTELHFSETKDE